MADLFPYPPNWSKSVDLTMAFKTDIFVSRSGKEQRRALRSTPRRTVEYETLVYNDSLIQFTRTLARKQNREFLLPDWTVQPVRTLGAATGSVAITLRTKQPPEWLAEGATVVLIDGEAYSQATVLSVSRDTLTITSPLTSALSSNAVIRRSMLGMLTGITETKKTATVSTVAITFEVTPTTYASSTDKKHPYIVGGKEVFAFGWNWKDDPSTSWQWSISKVDFDRGAVVVHRPVDFGNTTQQFTINAYDTILTDLFRFVERQKGQLSTFWIPSGSNDMDIALNIAAGTTSFTVAGSDLAGFSGDPVYSAVGIYLKDGRRVFRKINNIIIVSGNSVVNLSQPFTFAINKTNIGKVCWLRPARFASDEATISFTTDNLVEWQPSIISVTNDSDPQDYTDLDTAALWLMDNWYADYSTVFDEFDYMVNGIFQ